VEVTPLTNRAFRSARGLVGGLTLLPAVLLSTVGLSGCGAPAYTYVADSSAGTYYKVPHGWHAISQQSLNAALSAAGGSGQGIWSTAFDADSTPSANHFLAANVSQPFVFAEVGTVTSTVSNELSYNMLRDFMLPVTASTRQADAQNGFPLTNFKQLADDTITGKQGVHGVREIYQYTFPDGISDTFDQVALTNSTNTTVYFLLVHCENSCYTANEKSIDAVMTSFTVGSPT
jgi:hypothetical protein